MTFLNKKSAANSLMLTLLTLLLISCGSKEKSAPTQEVADPSVVELAPELQKQIEVMKVGDAEIRELLRIPGSIQVD
jgi:cobalt-zinc-cadmium efflux system membrane fusion protein